MKNLILSPILFSLLSTTAFAVCTDAQKKMFDAVVSDTGATCVGVVHPSNPKATDGIDGDLLWLQNGKSLRVGAAVDKIVVVKDGVLMVGYSGNSASVQFWDAASQKTKKCGQDVSARDVSKGLVGFDLGPDFITIKSKAQAVSYFTNCQDNGDVAVYAELTAADRAVLEQFRSSDSIPNDMTHPDVVNTLPEIIGRDELVKQLVATLGARQKRSTLLYGPAGVGKTALAERLAVMIARKEVPAWLQGWSVYMIALGKMNEEGQKGIAQKKMDSIVSAAAGKKVILVMDEIHQLIGLGSSKENANDITEVLKTDMANGRLAIIGTLTDSKDELPLLKTKEAFFSRFNKIAVGEPTDEVLLQIYKSRAKKEFKKNGVVFNDAVLKKLLEMTRKYIDSENNPRAGISIIELTSENLAVANVPKGYEVTLKDVSNRVGIYANIPGLINGAVKEGKENRTFKEVVKNFKKDISKVYYGQDAAKDAVYRTLVRVAAGNQKNERPSGIFLFLGPSGVGKTFFAETFASMFNLKYKVWPMSQYVNDGNVTNFLGAPPQFVGYNPAGGELARFLNTNPASVLNFDEADKSHPKILDMLLNLMDTGKMTDNSNVEASIRNGYMFFTSNFGMDLIDAYDREILKINDESQGKYSKAYKGYIPRNEEELKKELLNLLLGSEFGTYFGGRVGEENIVIFHHLNPQESAKIAEAEVQKAVKQMAINYEVEVDRSVIDYIAKNGISFNFGARKARGMAADLVTSPVSEKVLDLEQDSFSKLKVSLTVDSQNRPHVEVTVVK